MSIVFIDKGIKEFDDLYNELSKTHLVYLLDDKKNSFTQISELIGHILIWVLYIFLAMVVLESLSF